MPKRKTSSKSKAWKPLRRYEHQVAANDAYLRGILRFFLAWHRRAGKDVFGMDFIRERMEERVGTYWHMFPFHVQAKRAIWKGIDARTGEKFIDRAFDVDKVTDKNDTDMSLTYENGSLYQMLGSDNYDRHIGSNPCGIIFSEWALCDPAAWDYLRPILVENKGWAMFITTFRGRNHAWRMFENVKDLDSWYADLRTIADTHRHDGKPIVTAKDIEQEIKEGMDPALVEQEFYCNPNAATTGAIFNRQHTRLTNMQAVPALAGSKVVRVAWGLHGEGTAAVAFQGDTILGIHQFREFNIADAVVSVARRHPNSQLVHHAINPDPMLFNSLDGVGVVSSPLTSNEHMQHGHVAVLLNEVKASALARESLIDFAMSFAPYRELLDDSDVTHDALAQALAVMHTAAPLRRTEFKPMNYANYDRGVI